MKLLKNETEFKAWKVENILFCDEADAPKEFPCFVDRVVKNWSREEMRAVYFYRGDIQSMLDQLSAIEDVALSQSPPYTY